VPEHLRAFVTENGRLPTADDMELVARQHCAIEDALLATLAEGLVVYDTDLYTIVTYMRRYFGDCPPWIENEARAREADLYLLLAPVIPWFADPQRGGPHVRDEIHNLFQSTFSAHLDGGKAVIIYGDGEVRRSDAEKEVRSALQIPRP